MSKLRITDNHKFVSVYETQDDRYYHDDIDENVVDDLQRIANVEISELYSKSNDGNLLVFPRKLGYYGDDIGKGSILSLKENLIATNNIMGFVGVNNTQLDIVSRFARKDDEDFFLHYLLQKVFSINLFNIKHSTSHQPVFDFLLYLFPYFLKRALAQGIFKKYNRFEHNDSNICGPINIVRHIRENIPFRGTVAYSTRKHSYDNEITQLIRHTIEYVKTKEMGAAILNNDNETRDYVSQIILATPTYSARNRQKVINENVKPIHHPYYIEYTALQKICMQILKHEAIKYGQEKDKVYGILFDGAWLWEEYLNTILKDAKVEIIHSRNKTGDNGIPLFKDGKECYYPDFYKKNDGDKDGTHSFVLDAKYKRLEKGDKYGNEDTLNNIFINREDFFQMITYMHVLPAQHCALLYPIERTESCKDSVIESKSRVLEGLGGELKGYGIPISKEDKYDTFCQNQSMVEADLIDKIWKWII